MTRRVRLAILFAVAMVSAGEASAFPITIEPGAYGGRYKVRHPAVEYEFTVGEATFDLAPGDYSVELGASIGGSEFLFTVDGAGLVNTTSPAAVSSGSVLTFNTAAIAIDPGQYVGRYFLSSHQQAAFSGPKTVTLVPGITYSLDTGAHVDASAFAFSVEASGTVSTSSPSATANLATLTLANANETIDPGAYAERYYLTAFSPTPMTGRQTVVLVPGLRYGLDSGSNVGGSAFYFLLDATGRIVDVRISAGGAPAAVASGSTLTLLNVLVHADPTTYVGLYQIASYAGLFGPSDLVLIPNLVTSVTTATDSTLIVPGSSRVTPPGALTFTFTVSQQGFANGLIAEVAAYRQSGAIASAVATALTVAFNAAARLAATNPVAAQRLLGVISNGVVFASARGQIAPGVRDTLTAQIALWMAAL